MSKVMIIAAVIVGSLLVLEIWRYARSTKQHGNLLTCPTCEGHGGAWNSDCDDCNGYGVVPIDWHAKLTGTEPEPETLSTRVPMRNRFMGDRREDAPEIAALAAQIAADQHLALEKPGALVHAPAPGEPGYVAPSDTITVEAGAFRATLQRNGDLLLVEHGPFGNDHGPYEIPSEWKDVVAAFAFELACERGE